MSKKTTNKGMNGLPALATAAGTYAASNQGQSTISQGINAAKWTVGALGLYFVGRYAWGEYKEYRAEKYANDNAGNPHVIAAAIIHSSFTKLFDQNNWWTSFLPNPTIWTDEAALYKIAIKIKDAKKVAHAYKMMFDANLFFDTKNGLSTKEMQTFWNKINATSTANTQGEYYLIGTELYCAVKQGVSIRKAEKVNATTWRKTNDLFAEYKHNQYVGEVVARGKYKHPDGTLENFYIVDRGFFYWGFGYVLQHQIQKEEI